MPETSYSRRDALLRSLGFASYGLYLNSDLWRGIRYRVLALAKRQCCRCGGPATEVHHAAYDAETLRGLSVKRLVAVCRECHEKAEFVGDRKTSLAEANSRLKLRDGKAPPPKPKQPKGKIACPACGEVVRAKKLPNHVKHNCRGKRRAAVRHDLVRPGQFKCRTCTNWLPIGCPKNTRCRSCRNRPRADKVFGADRPCCAVYPDFFPEAVVVATQNHLTTTVAFGG